MIRRNQLYFLSHFRPAEVKWIFELIFSNNSTWLLSAGSLSILLWWGSREGTESCSPQRRVLTKYCLEPFFALLKIQIEWSTPYSTTAICVLDLFGKLGWKLKHILYSGIHAAHDFENSKSGFWSTICQKLLKVSLVKARKTLYKGFFMIYTSSTSFHLNRDISDFVFPLIILIIVHCDICTTIWFNTKGG
jgi:hypothetical protein